MSSAQRSSGFSTMRLNQYRGSSRPVGRGCVYPQQSSGHPQGVAGQQGSASFPGGPFEADTRSSN